MNFLGINNGTPGVPGVAFSLEIAVCFTHPVKNFSNFRGKTSALFGVKLLHFMAVTNGRFELLQMDFLGTHKWTFLGPTNRLFGDSQMDFWGTPK